MLADGSLLTHVGVSLERVLVGYAAGCIIGVLIGALIGRVQTIGQFAEPILQLMRPISPVALVPLSIIWFGIGDMSRYFIIFYGVVIIMIMNTAAGVSSTPNIRLNAARCLGATRISCSAACHPFGRSLHPHRHEGRARLCFYGHRCRRDDRSRTPASAT